MQQSKIIMRLFFFMPNLSFLTRVSYFPIVNCHQRSILSIKILDLHKTDGIILF